jgi:tetrapyrrole methylase family protein/MazG family protein
MAADNKQTADTFIELLEVLRLLRAPGGCPWDQKQTSQSLVPYLLEETYEIIEAIEEGDIETLK